MLLSSHKGKPMQTFENFLSVCGIDEPEILITFLQNFSEDFDLAGLPANEKKKLEDSFDRVLNKFN